METYNFLLLSSSNHVQLINSFKEAYIQLNLKGNIYTGDLQQFCASGIVSEKHFTIPRSDSKDFFLALKKIIEEYNINIVTSARDEELFILSQNKKFFDELGCFLLVSSELSIKLSRDKYELYLFFKKNNIPHPKTFLFEELKDNEYIKYPLICKPRIGKGGIGIHIINNYKAIKYLISNTSNYIFQEFINGTEYTIDILIDLEGNPLSIIPRKRVLIKGGESIISITEKNEILINYARILCEKIKFMGHINMQCIIKDREPYFLEINPRFGGASNCSFKAGMNSPLIIMKLIFGEKVEPFIAEFEEDLMMLRYSQDFIIKKNEY